jgi:catecholate siderophore receptor
MRLSLTIALRLSTLLLAAVAAVAGVPAAHAQTAATRWVFEGTVLDATRAAIAGAHVTAQPAQGGPAVSAVTDARGEFTLSLDVGRYAIRVAAPGFVDAAITQTLRAPQPGRVRREFVLEIAGLHEAVTISAPAGYTAAAVTSATRTPTPLHDVPQSITVITQELMKDQLMTSLADVVRYVPGITSHQGENNRDQIIVRGNSSSADFFLDGVRDDVQYYRDVYNLDRIEALKGSNAMIFGRGGGGGVVNRVAKEAGFGTLREVTLQGGTYGDKRLTGDLAGAVSQTVAVRMNGMFEDADSFRRGVGLRRYGITPSVTIAPDNRTKITLRYEHLHDTRVADRGITSFRGRPADVAPSTFYGDPRQSDVRSRVNLGSMMVERQVGRVTLRNRTLFGDYDRFYQNFVPGAVTVDRRQVALSAYNNATTRTNLFNQTDAIAVVSTGRFRHTLLAGGELGRQLTDNFRQTGFFNNTATSMLAPYDNPTISVPVTFRQNATDADNHLRTNVAAVYGQDQIQLSERVQVVAGLRFDRFDLTYHNNRNGDALARPDNLVSPRTGVVFTPIRPVSVYGSYSVSYLPSSGDQFSSLTTITQQLKPERFNNYEVGMKWEAAPSLELTTAAYRLDRTNTRSTDPNDPTRIVQTGSQRTNGYELGINGRVSSAWRMAGGYAWQDAVVTSATTAARAGARVGQVPRHTLSLWNQYQAHPKLAFGLGVVQRSDMFAAIDNTVTLPGYVRVDAAAYYRLGDRARLQANVENALNRAYFLNADSNTNISPGAPRTLRVALTTRF